VATICPVWARHFIGNNGKVFDLVVQRSSVTGQVELDLELDSNNSTQAPDQNIDGMKRDLNQFLIFYNFNRGHGGLRKEIKVRTPYDWF
jgi:hypothetical protein